MSILNVLINGFAARNKVKMAKPAKPQARVNASHSTLTKALMATKSSFKTIPTVSQPEVKVIQIRTVTHQGPTAEAAVPPTVVVAQATTEADLAAAVPYPSKINQRR